MKHPSTIATLGAVFDFRARLPFWPWLWADPFSRAERAQGPEHMREMAERRLRVNYETARAPIPNQYALVHRADIQTLMHELWRRRAQAEMYARHNDRAEFLLALLAECFGRRIAEVHTLLLPSPVEDDYGVARDATDQQKAARHDMIRSLFRE